MSPTLIPMAHQHRRCRAARARMSELLDGELDRRGAAGVERHARWCPNCRRMLKSLRRVVGGLRELDDRRAPADGPRR